MTPTDTMVPPEETDTGMETASPTDTNGAGQARSVVQGFFDALKSGNADQVVGAFADDAWVAVEGEPTAKGSEAIRTLFQDKLKAANGMGKATHSIEDAQALGDEGAVVRSTSKHEGEEYRELFVLMQDGGEWKITQFMNNGTA